MRQTRYLRTDEHEEAVRSLEWAEAQARSLGEDSYQWKWVLISLHNAVQGFMVLALWQGNGLLALRDKIAGKWLKAYRDGGDYPAEKLDEFLNLYQKVKDKDNMVLRCLAWVATISVWKHEIEFGCEQVNHGFEVADCAVTASLCFGGLDEAVDP